MSATVLIMLAVFGVICGQLLLKSGMSKIGKIDQIQLAQVMPLTNKIISQKKVIYGLLCYVGSSVLWIYILSFTDLSFAFPFLSIAYVGVPSAAAIILHEKIPLKHWLGILLVVTGILIVANSP